MSMINIFKVGAHTDSAGRRRTWTSEDLDRIVSNYGQRTEDAPVVFGHPSSEAPAQGWIKSVRNQDGVLQAEVAQISDTARKAMDTGAYKYGSLSLTPDLRIRHFGLLGAVPPAVKGLGRVEFEDGGLTVDVNFNEPDQPAKKEPDMTKELEAKLAEAEKRAADEKAAREKAEASLKAKESEFAEAAGKRRKADLSARVDQLVESGKLLPADKDKVLAFCEAMGGTADNPRELSFSDGEGKKPLLDHFMEFMAGRPEHGLFTEFQAPAKDGEPSFDGGDLARKF